MGFSRTELLVVMAIICILIAILIPAVNHARESARRTQSKNNLKNMGLSLYNYASTYGCLPAGGTFDASGRGYHGWTVSIIPFVDANNLSDRLDFSQPWDSPRNADKLIFKCPLFQNPGEPSNVGHWQFNHAHYSANAYLLAANSSVRLEDIDSKEQTFLAAELGGDFVPWACPYNFRPLTNLNGEPPTYGRYSQEGGFFLFAGGHVQFVSNKGFPALRDSMRGADLAEFGQMSDRIVRPSTFPIPKSTMEPGEIRLTDVPPFVERFAMGMKDYRGEFINLEFRGGEGRKGRPEIVHELDVAIIAKHLELEELRLGGDYTDRALPQLKKLIKLRNLHLSSDFITESGLSFVDDLPKLKRLKVEGKQITNEVRQRLPNCEIEPGDL